MLFVLVRHAHAGDKSTWPHADAERPISLTGRQESAGLVESIGGLGLRTLLSSSYLRCRQTLDPLTSATGLTVHNRPELLPDADPADLDRLLADPAVDGAALCTHGETIAALLRRWRETGQLETGQLGTGQLGAAPRPDATPKGAAWVVHTSGARRTLLYVPPLRVARSRLQAYG